MTILAYTDGASRGNPGESGIGVLLKDEGGNILASLSDYVGQSTNNAAEYRALLSCLKLAREMRCSKLILHSDSELMVKQVQGMYKVKDAGLKRYFQRVQRFLSTAPFAFEIRHVSREDNHDADELANRGINLKRRVTDIVQV